MKCMARMAPCILYYGTPFVTKFSRSNYTKEVNEDVTGAYIISLMMVLQFFNM